MPNEDWEDVRAREHSAGRDPIAGSSSVQRCSFISVTGCQLPRAKGTESAIAGASGGMISQSRAWAGLDSRPASNGLIFSFKVGHCRPSKQYANLEDLEAGISVSRIAMGIYYVALRATRIDGGCEMTGRPWLLSERRIASIVAWQVTCAVLMVR